jgi:hypothetical protein
MPRNALGCSTIAGQHARQRGGRFSGAGAARLALGALLGDPTGSWAQDNTTTTTSTSSHTTFNDSFQADRIEAFRTRITARLDGGATLFDQTFNLAFDDPAVQAVVAAAQAALNAAASPKPRIVGPLRFSTSTILADTGTATTETPTGSQQEVTLEETIGPDTAAVGNRDIDGGEPFLVAAGSNNFNINTHTAFFVDRLFLKTETYLTTEHYELIGHPL